MSETLYERLGGRDAIAAIVNDLVDAHASNPIISTRYAGRDLDRAKQLATDFMCMGTGGPEKYTGEGLVKVHQGMNVNERELIAVMDDLAEVLEKHEVGQRENDEIVGIFMKLKDDVLHK